MPRRALASVLLLLGSLALTAACSTGSSPAHSAPAEDGPSRSRGNDTGTQVDLTKLKGISIVSDSSADRSCPWATSYPDVPGAGAMTSAMKKDVEGRLAVFLGTDIGGPPSCGGPDGPEGPELNVSFSFLVASGDVLGVRLGTVDRTSNADGLGTRAYWYDGAARKYRPAPGLIADGSRDPFVTALKKRLQKREGVTPDTVEAALGDQKSRDSYLDDMAFTTDGDLKVDFDRGTVGLPPAGRISITLPKATVTPWLSDFGSRAQHQTTDPDDKLDLGAAHTPAPTVAPSRAPARTPPTAPRSSASP